VTLSVATGRRSRRRRFVQTAVRANKFPPTERLAAAATAPLYKPQTQPPNGSVSEPAVTGKLCWRRWLAFPLPHFLSPLSRISPYFSALNAYAQLTCTYFSWVFLVHLE